MRSSPLLSVIIPVHDESRTIDLLIERVLAVQIDMEVIVVDDGSNDGTSQLLEKWKHDSSIHVLKHPTNQGKGAAIRSGLQWATGQYVIVQDGDLELDPEVYPALLQPLITGTAEIVVGSRFPRSQRSLGSFFFISENRNWIS